MILHQINHSASSICPPFILQRTLQRRDALYLLHLTRRCLRKFPRGGKSLISEEISLPLGGTGHGRTDLADERKTRKATQKRKKTFPSTKPEETHNSVTSSMSTFSVLTVAIGQYQCIMHSYLPISINVLKAMFVSNPAQPPSKVTTSTHTHDPVKQLNLVTERRETSRYSFPSLRSTRKIPIFPSKRRSDRARDRTDGQK